MMLRSQGIERSATRGKQDRQCHEMRFQRQERAMNCPRASLDSDASVPPRRYALNVGHSDEWVLYDDVGDFNEL
jgi:hypothetical protein